jgi:hypothetical protein
VTQFQNSQDLKLPNSDSSSIDQVLENFLNATAEKKIDLYPAQEEAILELYAGKNVILNTPTGSGKSLVAAALHFLGLATDRRSVYTCPIKALVNEKFLALCQEFGPENVGLATGDATVNPGAPILCCTAEILSNQALRMGAETPIQDVIMDEFHYYSDRDRGVAWQIPLIALPQARFLLMSATLGDTRPFELGLTELNQRETVVVRGHQRPVPLAFEYSENPLHEAVEKLITLGRAPIYLVHFSQRECSENAQNFLSLDFCTKEEKKKLQIALEGTQFSSPYGKEIQKLLKHGIGIHHAGLLPKYRILVERLAQKGLLKLIFGTDTLGVGVNVPIRTVIFTKLCKFDGEKTTLLSVRDFHQISGRAGRRGFDHEGFVVAQGPEHIIENLRLEQKAAGDSKKMKKLVKRKPPEKGYIPWSRETFQKLIDGQPEALTSRFKVTHSMLLNVLGRKNEDGCDAMRSLIRNSHETQHAKKNHRKVAFQLFRSLLDRKIIELNPLRLQVDLQEDFSLNHALSLYLIDTLSVLHATDPHHALDVLTLVESILENPDLILRKQLDRIKTEKMDEMKLAGIEYDERIAELEKLEYPKPNQEFIYQTFNHFIDNHPWINGENIRPKSIAREMVETFQSFSEYVRDYGLQKSEGLLLRYLTEVYQVLSQTVPSTAKTDEVYEIEFYLKTLVRHVDSSLLDEWEKMRDPNWKPKVSQEKESAEHTLAREPSIFDSPKKLEILIRNEVFKVIRALTTRDFEEALSLIAPTEWSIDRFQKTLQEYLDTGHSRICTDTKARFPKNTVITQIQDPETQRHFLNVQQVLVDPEGHNDWIAEFLIDLEKSRSEEKLALTLKQIAPI